MANPTRQIIDNGSIANDGKGDTLRDAATKMNDNFGQLWSDVYSRQEESFGRSYTCKSISGDVLPESGEFSINTSNWSVSQTFTINSIDNRDRKISYAGIVGEFPPKIPEFPTKISFWQKDHSDELRLDDWKLFCIIEGVASYNEGSNNWEFTKTSLIASAGTFTDSSDSNRNDYYIKLHGVW